MDKAPLLSAKRVDYRSRLRSRVSKVQRGGDCANLCAVGKLVVFGSVRDCDLRRLLSGLLGSVCASPIVSLDHVGVYAFGRAKEVVWVLEVVWTRANIGNALLGAVDTLIPLWNSGSNYIVEPAVYILLDVFSLIFTGNAYGGLITEASVPYAGFDCKESTESQSWCGNFDYYEARLQDADASGSTFVENSIVLGAATSRRLSELTGEVIVPVLDLSEMTNGLTLLSSSLITMLGSLGDTLMHVLYTVLSEVAVFILDLLVIILKELMKVIMMIVQSGVLEDIINVAVDILTIFIIKVAIPLIMAAIDLLMCALDVQRGVRCAAAVHRRALL